MWCFISQFIVLKTYQEFNEIDDKGSASLLATVARTYAFSHFHSSSTQRRGKSVGRKLSHPRSGVIFVLCLVRARARVIFTRRLSSFRVRDTRLQKAETGAAFWNNVGTLKGEPSVGVS